VNLAFHQVDVFTSVAFGGNPLAVFFDAGDALDTTTMQQIAREMNLSETTFVSKPTDSTLDAHVRIFTPGQELPFAGHPTIGTAFVLDRLGRFASRDIAFEMGVGTIRVHNDGDLFWMTPPPVQPSAPVVAARDAARALHLPDAACAHDAVTVGAGKLSFLCVLLDSPHSVDAVTIDRAVLTGATGAETADGDLLIFSYADGRAYSRMFAHASNGIGEDPATGSSAAPLCVALNAYGVLPSTTRELTIAQGMKMGRPSELFVRFDNNGSILTNIQVGGRTVPILEGTLTL
jgi:trans-2,3-dihydro-3-hydroxyanthranilate isomerase